VVTTILRALAAVAALASMGVTLVVTHLPAPSAVGVSEDDPDRVAVRGVWHALGEAAKRLPDAPAFLEPLLSDETVHFGLFFVPAVFWSLAAGRRLRGRHAAALFVLLAAWGALDELSQHLTGREGQWGDWLANMAGAAAGIALAWPVLRAWDRRRTVLTGVPRPG
jgi:VanZ family protein